MMKHFGRFTKISLMVGLLFVIYGYVCRLSGFYFFWESKSIGWAIVFIGIISLLFDRIKIKRKSGEKSIFERIGIAVIGFILLVQLMLISIVPITDAYAVAKKVLKDDAKLKSEIGEIQAFVLIPIGGIQKTTDSEGTYGSATINLTAKGQNKFKDITIYVTKYADQPEWIVEGIE